MYIKEKVHITPASSGPLKAVKSSVMVMAPFSALLALPWQKVLLHHLSTSIMEDSRLHRPNDSISTQTYEWCEKKTQICTARV